MQAEAIGVLEQQPEKDGQEHTAAAAQANNKSNVNFHEKTSTADEETPKYLSKTEGNSETVHSCKQAELLGQYPRARPHVEEEGQIIRSACKMYSPHCGIIHHAGLEIGLPSELHPEAGCEKKLCVCSGMGGEALQTRMQHVASVRMPVKE